MGRKTVMSGIPTPPGHVRAKLPAYHCRLCGGNAFVGIEADASGKKTPIPFPDTIRRPWLPHNRHAVMEGVDQQLRPRAPDSEFVCKKCFETRLSAKALAPLRGRSFNFADPHDKKGPAPAESEGYGYCSVM